MSEMTDIPDDDSVLAAEYVLGLLSEPEEDAFAGRLFLEPDLRRACDLWAEHFATLADAAEAVRPPASLWPAIRARAYGPHVPFWKRLNLGTAVIGTALAAGLAFAALRFGWLEPVPLPLTAELSSETAGQVARIALDPESGAIEAELVGLFPDAGRARELWLIQGGNPPVSLGLLDAGTVVRLDLPADLRASLEGAVLAISDEPAGGSPTGQPTGAVLATGAVTAL
ncbi:anti-sigma factor domain-containing protein [Marinovum sp.]|uniref:anti-sigma factor n=1 Tax=Marinovum sp. TaxID=2024839 RepID=UPI002B277266|nr:anti-sigma factor [Marinovum sp.]